MLWWAPSPALLPSPTAPNGLWHPASLRAVKLQRQLISFKHAKLSDEAPTVQTTQPARQLKQPQQKADCPLPASLAVKCPFWPVRSGSLCSTLSLALWKLGGAATPKVLLGALHGTTPYSLFVGSGRVLGWGWWKARVMLDRALALLEGWRKGF